MGSSSSRPRRHTSYYSSQSTAYGYYPGTPVSAYPPYQNHRSRAYVAGQGTHSAMYNPQSTRVAGTSSQTQAIPNTALSQHVMNALAVHNQARAQKGIPPLQWDAKLAQDAQEYANQIVSKGDMEHSTCPEGENLFEASWHCTFEEAVKDWMEEESIYHGEVLPNGRFDEYGHYTQIMWSTTTHVGMGMAHSWNGHRYVVARYNPPGNKLGSKPW